MSDAESGTSALAVSAGSAGPHATDAFALLGNETRLSILLVLWEAHEPRAADAGVPFSQILERVDCDDPGNLRYHLEKLDGQFVDQPTDRGGYTLRRPGLDLVRAVIAGAGAADVTRPPATIDQACPCCGATTVVEYRDGLLRWACESCAGVVPEATEATGTLSLVPFEPAGLTDRSPGELKVASEAARWTQVRSFFDGICPTCTGAVDGRLTCCVDHDETGVCASCGTRFTAQAEFTCRICGNYGTTTPARLALCHPTVVAFYADHGVATRVHVGDTESGRRVNALVAAHETTPIGTDRARVTATRGADSVAVTFDGTAAVVDVRR